MLICFEDDNMSTHINCNLQNVSLTQKHLTRTHLIKKTNEFAKTLYTIIFILDNDSGLHFVQMWRKDHLRWKANGTRKLH